MKKEYDLSKLKSRRNPYSRFQSSSKSPLDVKGVKTKARTEDIILAVRESRKP
jgi:hypothetical protein